MNKTEPTNSWFSKRVKAQLSELSDESHSGSRAAIVFVSIFILIVLYFGAHQTGSTGFFTTKFGTFETLLLYGSLFEWITVGVLEFFGRKNLSRDIDAFGGIIFVTIAGIWLFVIFPFEFTHFADVLPDSLRFLLQWISNEIAVVIMVLGLIVAPIMAVYQLILYNFVKRELQRR